MFKDEDYSDIAKFLDDKSKKKALKTPFFVDPNNTDSRAMMSETPFSLLRPHNCRRQIKIEPVGNSPIRDGLLAIKEAKENSHTKVITIKNYKNQNVTIQIAKKTITAMYNQKKRGDAKETYKVTGTKKDISIFIKLKLDEIRHLLDFNLKTIIEVYGITKYGEATWGQRDFWLRHSSDKLNLPEDSIIDASHFYKSYKTGYEIRLAPEEDEGEIVQSINNSKLMDLEPEIVKEITELKKFVNPLRYLKHSIQHPMQMLKYEGLVKMLTKEEKEDIWEYFFQVANEVQNNGGLKNE